jgi:hypothetical protein
MLNHFSSSRVLYKKNFCLKLLMFLSFDENKFLLKFIPPPPTLSTFKLKRKDYLRTENFQKCFRIYFFFNKKKKIADHKFLRQKLASVKIVAQTRLRKSLILLTKRKNPFHLKILSCLS